MFASIMCSGYYVSSLLNIWYLQLYCQNLKHNSSVTFPVLRTHCGEFVCRDFFLALCDGVEEQVLQAGQDACLSSPAAKKYKKHTERKSEKNNSTVRPCCGGNMEGKLQQREEEKKLFDCKEKL